MKCRTTSGSDSSGNFAKPLLANVLGLLLYGGALMAMGMWFSTFTKNQIIAGAVGLVVFLLLYVLDWMTEFTSGAAGRSDIGPGRA